MRRNPRAVIAASLLTAVAITLAACSGSSGGGSSNGSSKSNTTSPNSTAGYNAAANNVVNKSTKTGGTLNLLASSDCDSWDPKITYYGWCINMQRLFTRTLVGYTKVNGTQFTLGGDLATGLGTHNADFTKWTYTLRPGLKYSTGKAITPLDVKYGVERNFNADVLVGGPSQYFTSLLVHPKNYSGPYKDGDLSSITTTSNTITFSLTKSFADWNYVMALPAAAPVPYKVEGGKGFVGSTYTKHPVSSGPYEIQSYTQNKQITFVRNPMWQQSSDPIVHPLVDKVVLTVDTNLSDIDQKLQAGTADARADNGVQSEFQSKILTQPSLKANADDPVVAATRYLSIAPSVIPNVHCRQAIFYALDKAGALRAAGGSVAGNIAGSFTPPGLPGYDPSYDPYPSGSGSSGNLAKAKAELTACGKPNGFSTKFAYGTPSTYAANIFKAEQSALAKVGIKITAAPQNATDYYKTYIGSPANIKAQGLGIAFAGWGADFPTDFGFYNAIANGSSILSVGNSNYPSLNDPTVNKILDNPPPATDVAAYKGLNQAIMKSAVYLPLYWEKTLYYRNPRMTNVTSNNAEAFGIYDFVNVGVTK